MPKDHSPADSTNVVIDMVDAPHPSQQEPETTKTSDSTRTVHSLVFKDISFSLESGQCILHPISGRFTGGQMAAIMGASGSGKTTFVDVLCGRKNQIFKGNQGIYVDGVKVKNLANISAYVPQEEPLRPTLTVREVMTQTADLSLNLSPQEKRARVDEILAQLGLTACADTRIGSDLVRGISGGQRKRLSVARGLIRRPAILFVDEPTSGLSAADSESLIDTLRALARSRGTLVIAVVHQPRASVFAMFDHLLLMVLGRAVYNGPVDGIAEHLTVALNNPPPLHENVADFMLDCVTVDHRLNVVEKAIERYASVDAAKVSAQVDAIINNATALSSSKRADGSDSEVAGSGAHNRLPARWAAQIAKRLNLVPDRCNVEWHRQFRSMLRIHGLVFMRDKTAAAQKVMATVIQCVLLGAMFFNIGDDELKRGSVVFFFTTLLAIGEFDVLPLIVQDRGVFESERVSGLYSGGPYYAALSIISQSISALALLIGTAIVFFMSGLAIPGTPPAQVASTFFALIGVLILSTSVMTGSLHMIATLSKSFAGANAIAGLIIGIFALFSGLLVNPATLPTFLLWLLYLSPFFYTFEASFSILLLSGGPPTERSVSILSNLGMSSDNIPRDVAVLAGMAVFVRLGAYLVIKYVSRMKR